MKRFKLFLFFLTINVSAFSQEAAVTFLFSSIAPCGNNTACVEVTTDDFSNVLYVKMPIKWDPKIVKLKEIKLGKLRNISLNNFNQTRALTEGLLFFEWKYDDCDKPKLPTFLVPDGDVIFSLCFEPISTYGASSTIGITTDSATLKNNDVYPVEIFKNVGCKDVGFIQKRGNISTCVRALTLSGEPMSGKTSEIACTPVKVTGLDSIAGIQFVMQWQDTLLEFADLKISNSTIPGLSKGSFGLPADTKKSNALIFAWQSSTGKPAALVDNSEIFKVCFKLIGPCQKVTTVDFAANFGVKMEATSEGRVVSPTTGKDTFRLDVIALVGEEIVTTISKCDPDGLKIHIDCGPEVEIGAEKCVAVVADQNLEKVKSLEYQMTYDPEILNFVRVEKFTSKLSQFNSLKFNASVKGVLGLDWKSSIGNRTINTGDTLYKVCFDVLGVGAKVTPLKIVNATGKVLIDSSDPLNYFLNATNCAIQIKQPPGVVFTIGDGEAKKGETVCLPVQVSNFKNKDTLVFNLSWEPGQLTFLNLKDEKLAGIKTDKTNVSDGLLGLSWASPTPSGAALSADKSEILKACFQLVGNNPFDLGQTTNCSFVEVPSLGDSYSTSPSLGGQRLENSQQFEPGEICILNPNGFVLFSENNKPKRTSTHCVDFKVQDFKDITKSNFTLSWSPAAFQFTEVKKLNTSLNLSLSSHFNTGSSALGALEFNWSQALGKTLPDFSILFSVCYKIVGDADTCYKIKVEKTPPSLVTTQIGPGQLFFREIPVCVTDTLFISRQVNQVTCANGSDGSVQVAVNGGKGPFIYSWISLSTGRSLGSTAFIKNIPPGKILLTVTDLSNINLVSKDTITVGVAPGQPTANAGLDALLRCVPRSLQLAGTGTVSTPGSGINVSWITPNGRIEGNNEQSVITVTEPGLYIYQVENAIGCIAKDTVVVTSIPFYRADAGSDRILTCNAPTSSIGTPILIKGDSLSVSWKVAEGGFLSPGQEKLDTPKVSFGGAYILTVRNIKNGCVSTDTVKIINNVLKPVVSLGNDLEIGCKGESITLRATVQPHPNPLDYLWETEKGGFLGLSQSTSVRDLGSYTVLVRDLTSGCSTRDTIKVIPNADYARFSLADTTSWTCLETKATLNAQFDVQRDKYTIQWTASNGGILPPGQDTLQKPKVERLGVYTIKTTNSVTGCVLTASTLLKDIREVVSANLIKYGDTLTCREPRILMDGIADTENENLQYSWFLNGNQIAKDTLSIEAKAGGVFAFKAKDKINFCEGIDSVKIISQLDSPKITLVTDPKITCKYPQGNISVSISPTADYSYAWLTLDGVIASGFDSPNPKVATQGTYVLQVKNKVTLCEGGIDVLVGQDKSAPEAKIIFNDTQLTCARDSLELRATTLNNNAARDKYAWLEVNGDPSKIDSNLIYKVKKEGVYRLLVTNSLTGCQSIDSIKISENKRLPDAFVVLSGPITCNNPVVELSGQNGSSVGPDYQVSWLPLNNQLNAIQLTTDAYLVKINKPGNYSLDIKDKRNGCIGSAKMFVPDSTQLPRVNLISPQPLACPGKFSAINTTGTDARETFVYVWQKIQGGDSIANGNQLNAQVNQMGTYTLDITNSFSGCKNRDTVVFILDPSLPLANAGTDAISCTENTNLKATLATGNTGKWTVTGGPQVELPDNPGSFAFGLKIGRNTFAWTVSTATCTGYSVDSVVITRETNPVAVDDLLSIPTGTRKGVLIAIQNDQVSKLGGYKLSVLTQPVKGLVDSIQSGNIHYKVKPGGSGDDSFSYLLCNNACPTLCDTAGVRVSIAFDPEAPLPVVPNTITPNEDGKNDALAFEILDEFPDDYPDAELIVFSRWGDIVFTKRPYKNDWKGTNTLNQPLPDGTYYFILRLNVPNGKIEKGDVTIIR
jgi:gliding motility-associated-like protein